MILAGFGRLVVLLVMTWCAVFATTHRAGAGIVGGTTITNVATATFASSNGLAGSSTSNSVTTVVASIGSVVVSPKQTGSNPATDSVPAGTPAVRTFTISNTSNIPDAYTITAATASAGRIASIAYVTSNGNVAVTPGSTVSPVLAPGSSIQVVVTLATIGLAVGTQVAIGVTARTTVTTTANGLQTDSGQLWAVIAVGPKFDGPGGGSTIQKFVQDSISSASAPGSTVTYSIQFKNDGGSPATNAIMTDDIPTGIQAQPATVSINGVPSSAKATLSGQTLTVAIGNVAPAASINVTFDATVSAKTATGTTFVNIASVSADNIAAAATTPAVVLVGFSNIVFDGYDGQKHPVAGAVASFVDDQTGAPVALPTPDPSVVPPASTRLNANNANPFTTGADGRYAWYFLSSQGGAVLGTRQAQAAGGFDLIIKAPNYTPRRIGVTLAPSTASPLLYDATLTSKDGMPLAAAGGFALVEQAVSIENVFGVLDNIPLFGPRPISITKTADRTDVSAGDRVVFTLQYANTGSALGRTSVIDTLPPGLAYAPATARIDGTRVEPSVAGRTLTWTFPSLDSATHTIVYATVVIPGVQENTVLTNTAKIDALPPNSTIPITASAQAVLTVVAGALSESLVITGRVYLDRAASGRFARGDEGVPGVRIFLENGASAATDTFGRYSFPSVRPGMHVLRIDPTTVPRNAALFAVHGDDDRAPQRLVHGIMDSRLIEDVNFAIAPVSP